MPALYTHHDTRPSLGHVGLMVDTLIANASPDDLRAITRSLLASATPGLGSAFITAAQSHLGQIDVKKLPAGSLFVQRSGDKSAVPAAQLKDTLARARSLFGAGLGFASLHILAAVVRATIGTTWEEEGAMADALAVVDADIAQAIQSAKEEADAGRVRDLEEARDAVGVLRAAVEDSRADVQAWGGEYPFERALTSVGYWKL